ncbi:universal stress protein [Saccharothrix lopnurensis]|uniref:Universal stress protein n=1 Tax=Saccharothrix lopnurensis TaxID=1670621 RepID=A0ABW1NYA0_9PSEU
MSGEQVVVGVDGTDGAARAAEWAARRAALWGLPLLLVHGLRWPLYEQVHLHQPVDVAGEEAMRQWARDLLDDVARRCRARGAVDVRAEVVPGDPADVLVRAAEGAAFVVVGHSDGGGVTSVLLGSTAAQVVQACARPVVVVRAGEGGAGGEGAGEEGTGEEGAGEEGAGEGGTPGGAGEARGEGGPVVVGVDGSPIGGRALRFAHEFAERAGVGLLAVHAVADGAVPYRVEEDADLAECARLHPGVRARVEVVPGPPVEVLLAAARTAGLLVVGSHGAGVVRRALFGSVSQSVVDRAACPVAVLPPHAGA